MWVERGWAWMSDTSLNPAPSVTGYETRGNRFFDYNGQEHLLTTGTKELNEEVVGKGLIAQKMAYDSQLLVSFSISSQK